MEKTVSECVDEVIGNLKSPEYKCMICLDTGIETIKYPSGASVIRRCECQNKKP